MKVTQKDNKIKQLRQSVKVLDQKAGRVGWFPSARYEDGAPVAGIAVVQEFGSPKMGIPPRAPLRRTVAEHEREWVKNAEEISRGVMRGQFAPGDVMELLTLKAEGDVRATIASIHEPGLAESTVDARKRRLANGGKGATQGIRKPLVDLGIMLATVSSEVSDK